jgi:hypothetical protein
MRFWPFGESDGRPAAPGAYANRAGAVGAIAPSETQPALFDNGGPDLLRAGWQGLGQGLSDAGLALLLGDPQLRGWRAGLGRGLAGFDQGVQQSIDQARQRQEAATRRALAALPPPTTRALVGSIRQKQARGQSLTKAEQRILDVYGRLAGPEESGDETAAAS